VNRIHKAENNFTYLNEEHNSLGISVKISSDIEKQGHLAYDELESQHNLLQVLDRLYRVFEERLLISIIK
jgi:hypothetical protein